MRANASLLRRFGRLSRANRRVLAEALISLAVASLAVRILPFRRVAAWMGAGRSGGGGPDEAAAARLVNQCAWAVRSWADRVPWRAVCFQRGLALHLMLRRRGIRSLLHYGVAQDDKGLRAHVWVTASGRTVMGGEDAPGFTCLATFPAAG
jgi:hypothetical protein